MAAILPDERWRRLEAVFSAALELPAAEREAFVGRECGADRALAAEIVALLRNDVEADTEVADALAAGAAAVVTDPLIGRQIGVWRIEQQVGRRGMAPSTAWCAPTASSSSAPPSR
jgi:eukaryotic-like serine/threonine-protein kinase